jgi:hypothetical protein
MSTKRRSIKRTRYQHRDPRFSPTNLILAIPAQRAAVCTEPRTREPKTTRSHGAHATTVRADAGGYACQSGGGADVGEVSARLCVPASGSTGL